MSAIQRAHSFYMSLCAKGMLIFIFYVLAIPVAIESRKKPSRRIIGKGKFTQLLLCGIVHTPAIASVIKTHCINRYDEGLSAATTTELRNRRFC